MSSAGSAALTAARRRLAIRHALGTTPGRLRLAGALLALGAVVLGVVAAHAANARRDAVQRVAATEPLLVAAVDVSVRLSDAHAIAASGFLVGGPESASSRRDYAQALKEASVGVGGLARQTATSADSEPAVRRLAERLPAYAGLIDSARANHRGGAPVGSAYLRRASATMSDEILPAARDLYRIEAQRLTRSLRAGVSGWNVLVVILAGGALLVALATTQAYLARVTRRVVNVRLAAATAVLLALMAWTLVAFGVQRGALFEAQRRGSDPVELLTATRILASRAQAKESIALSARGGGGGEPRLEDVARDRGFKAIVRPIGITRRGPALGTLGLLDEAAAIAGDGVARIDAIYAAFHRYAQAHRRVVEEQRRGAFGAAVKLAVEDGPEGVPSSREAALDLDHQLGHEVDRAQRRFDDQVARADSTLGGLAAGIPVLTALCALLALAGVRERLEEYR